MLRDLETNLENNRGAFHTKSRAFHVIHVNPTGIMGNAQLLQETLKKLIGKISWQQNDGAKEPRNTLRNLMEPQFRQY